MLTALRQLRRTSTRTPAPEQHRPTETPTVTTIAGVVPRNDFHASVLRCCNLVTPGVSPEFLEGKLADAIDERDRATLTDQLAVARLDMRLKRRVDLRKLLGETKAVPGTGRLPVIAIFGVGNTNTTRRECVVNTHNASNRRGGSGVTFGGNQFALKFGNLTEAVSGKEERLGEQGHWEIRWRATLMGKLPQIVAGKLRDANLLSPDGGGGSGGTNEGATIPAAGTTSAVLAAPAEYGQTETYDPVVIRVRLCLDGSLIAWYDDDIGCFDMEKPKA